MKDFTIILHTQERYTPNESRNVSIGVEFNIDENIHQLFSRIEAKMKRELNWSDSVEIRKNNITK